LNSAYRGNILQRCDFGGDALAGLGRNGWRRGDRRMEWRRFDPRNRDQRRARSDSQGLEARAHDEFCGRSFRWRDTRRWQVDGFRKKRYALLPRIQKTQIFRTFPSPENDGGQLAGAAARRMTSAHRQEISALRKDGVAMAVEGQGSENEGGNREVSDTFAWFGHDGTFESI